MSSPYTLIVRPSRFVDESGAIQRRERILVTNQLGVFDPAFYLLCAAIDDDIQAVEGSGVAALSAIARVEQGVSEAESLGGNGWYTHLRQDQVWFESHYSQGEGGAVSLAQYKLAVQTYLQFLADPEAKPIVVPFPDA